MITFFKWVAIILVVLVLIYLIGPYPSQPRLKAELPKVPDELSAIERMVQQQEAMHPNIKPDNESKIVWADSIPVLTDHCLLYLHGFSASAKEGSDLAEAFSKRYHCNLYLPRLFAHGLEDENPLLNLDADSLYQSAAKALAVAAKMGKKVILMSTSTGGTISLKLASEFPDIAGLILYSPNVKINDDNVWLITKPWGLQLARQMTGSDFREFEANDYARKYWTWRYRLEGVRELQRLVENSMKPAVFKAVKQPIFLGYYFKDELHQDPVVSVPAALEMYEQLGTPADKKRKKAFPEAGDHVLANPEISGAYEEVKQESFRFAEEVLGLKPG